MPRPDTPWLCLTCDERVGTHNALHDLTLTAPWTVVFGPSGSGKSTLLRLIAGLTPQHTGVCTFRSRDLRKLPAHRRGIVLVEQSPALFPHRNVERNIAYACKAAPESQETVTEVLRDFHLTALRRASVQTLSGGERQRVAIARAICSLPQALLLDEVFTGMDAALRTDLTAVLKHYRERMQLPVLSVTHDIGEAFTTADEVLRMHNGRITAQGKPVEVLQAERDELLAKLQQDPSGCQAPAAPA